MSEDRSSGTVMQGVWLTFAITVAVDGVFIIAGNVLSYEPAIIATFAVFVFPLLLPAAATIPWAIVERRRGRTEVAKGILITAGALAAVNAACTGMIFGFSRLAG